MDRYKDHTFAICIGRTFGSGGLSFALQLREALSVPLYDKNLLDKASQDSNIRKELFEKIDEVNSFSMPMTCGSVFAGPCSIFVYPEHNVLSNENLFSIQAETIRRLAEKGSGIFVGRCSDYLLKEHPHLFSLFIVDDLPVRIQNVMSRFGIEQESEAVSMIEKMDKARREYYNYFTSGHWGRAENYDLSIKLSAIGTEYAVQMVVDLMRKRGFPLM